MDRTTVIIQAFSKDKVEVQVRNGNNLVDCFCINNGEEKLVELADGDSVSMTKVLKRVPKDHIEQ
tara:strand:+ start:470 stop:664 length:195 start_codon:yes stop_codon:yes gene_type:complete